MNIKHVLNALPAADREAIMSAFEAQSPYYVEYEPGRFIGVNTDEIPTLVTEAVAGSFRGGRIKRGGHETPAQGN